MVIAVPGLSSSVRFVAVSELAAVAAKVE